MTSLRIPFALTTLAITVACGCSPAAPIIDNAPPDAAPDFTVALDATATQPVDALPDCKDELGDRALGGVCVHTVTGRIVDEKGGPVTSATVTVCGSSCFYGMSDATGSFSVLVDEYLQVGLYSFLAHVNPRRACFYMALPAPVGTQIIMPAPIPLLPMPASGPVIQADMSAQTVTSNGVTLTIAAGTTIFFSVEDTADMPLGAQFRPLRLTTFDKVPFLGDVVPLVLYGFGPFEIDFRTQARLSFDNAIGLPAGTAVDVLGQRGLIRGSPPGAKFDVVAAAHVSLDAKTIEMDPGTGLDTLTWIALRKKENQP